MVGQNKRFSFKIKRQAKYVFPRDAERTVDKWRIQNFSFFHKISVVVLTGNLEVPTCYGNKKKNINPFCLEEAAILQDKRDFV